MRDSFLGGDAGADLAGDAGRAVRMPGYRLHERRFAGGVGTLQPDDSRRTAARNPGGSHSTTSKRATSGGLKGSCQFEDYHFVARLASGVCGYMQLFFHPVEKFAFVGFLVVRAGLSLGKQMAWVTARMCQEMTRKLALDKGFRACERIFLELDDPGRASGREKTATGRKKNHAIRGDLQAVREGVETPGVRLPAGAPWSARGLVGAGTAASARLRLKRDGSVHGRRDGAQRLASHLHAVEPGGGLRRRSGEGRPLPVLLERALRERVRPGARVRAAADRRRDRGEGRQSDQANP